MTRKVAVTGIGVKVPAGSNREEAWSQVLGGRGSARPLERFDAGAYLVGEVGTVNDSAFDMMPRRLLKRMDRFSRLTLAATEEALEDAGLDTEEIDRETVGVYLGNMYGGWEITDPSLRDLLQLRHQDVSPYVASAWFPTAPQGQVTIRWQLKGYSKTVSADTASSALAIGYAARTIQEGRADVMLCGGAEAPITPYALAFCDRSGRVSPDGYRPFDQRAQGFQVGEGATVLLLEELDSARARGASIYAELGGFATGRVGSSGCFSRDDGLSRSIVRAMSEADVAPSELDYVGLDAQGTKEADRSEAHSLYAALGRQVEHPTCTTVKPSTTHLLGGGAATEAAAALLAMRHGEVPPVAVDGEPDAAPGLRFVALAPAAESAQTALVNSRGADGTHAALVFRKAA